MVKITTKDIARLAGVSTATVSFALNGKPGVSDDTRKRILEIVAQTNYKPVSEKTYSNGTKIALLFRNNIPTLDQLFYTELNSIFIQSCEKLPYYFLVASIFYEGNKLVFSDMLRCTDLDAIVAYGDINGDILPEVNRLNVPILVLDSSRKEDNLLAVRVDYAAAAYTATRHLIDLGHRDIAYIGNDSLSDFNYLTFSGFQKATTEEGITLGMNRIQISVHDEASLINCIEHALSGPQPPTALFCATDFYAIHAIRYLHTRGMHVPNDVSVVGIDDISVSRFIIPSLTTVRIDREAMGLLGVELLKKVISKEKCSSVTLPHCDLVVRESTAPPRSFDR
jgi:DNA-binding LacI/PurR family transcriptional regulator